MKVFFESGVGFKMLLKQMHTRELPWVDCEKVANTKVFCELLEMSDYLEMPVVQDELEEPRRPAGATTEDGRRKRSCAYRASAPGGQRQLGPQLRGQPGNLRLPRIADDTASGPAAGRGHRWRCARHLYVHLLERRLPGLAARGPRQRGRQLDPGLGQLLEARRGRHEPEAAGAADGAGSEGGRNGGECTGAGDAECGNAAA